MDEQARFAATRPWPMLEYFRDRASDRKVRLFACACAWRLCAVFGESHTQEVSSWIVLSEELADGRANANDVSAARSHRWGGSDDANACVFYAAQGTLALEPFDSALKSAAKSLAGFAMVIPNHWEAEWAIQTALLRDIFGNPYRPVAFDAAWRTSTAVAQATQINEAREFGAMPILADALQDAGCDNGAMLDHCGSTKATHVRGCWVVDLILGMP